MHFVHTVKFSVGEDALMCVNSLNQSFCCLNLVQINSILWKRTLHKVWKPSVKLTEDVSISQVMIWCEKDVELALKLMLQSLLHVMSGMLIFIPEADV